MKLHKQVMLILIILMATNTGSLILTAPSKNHTLTKPSNDPEIWMSCAQIIEYWGYPVEQYDVTTDDGYILTMFRIPHGRSSTAAKGDGKRPVVLLQHGLDSSSYDWIINLPNESAGYVFADIGFDVWLGNFRGNTYGLKHVSLNSKDHSFWEFSWDEMGQHDLPALIGKALEVSNASSLYYVGHSMGTTAAFAGFSRNKELEKKVKIFYALAPVTTVKHIHGFFRWLAPFTFELDELFKLFGYDDFTPSDELTKLMAETLCSYRLTDMLCEDVMVLICGPESNQLNVSRSPVYVSHSPAGTSTQTVAHYGQMVNNGKFDMFDYGRRQNKKHYGQDKPPTYDVSQIDVPIYLFWGDSDWLADPKDVESLIPQLRYLVGNVYLKDFNHIDFIWGMRASAEIYWPIIKDIQEREARLA